MKRRVVVTGIGCITPIGVGAGALWDGVIRGRSSIRKIDRFDPSPFRTQIGAQVPDFSPEPYLSGKQANRLDRFAQFALVASAQAFSDAGLTPAEVSGERVGIFMGTALGGVGYGESQHEAYMQGGLRAVNPGLALTVFGGAASCNIAIHFGLNGPNETNAMSCASGAIAIGRGLMAVRSGEADVVLAGGAEAPLAPLCYGAFAMIRAMSTRNHDPETACRPFDADRDGFVMGEGAAVLVLEEWNHAKRRGANVYAELVGYGTSNDAYHMTAPRPDGAQAARAMTAAMRDGLVGPDMVGYVNAHGSSTPLNDVTESLAIHRALGSAAKRVPVSGTKALYGHPLGASGAIEAAIVALAMRAGYLPATANLVSPDPGARLRLIKGEGLESKPKYALSNSFGFGGINACLAFAQA